MCERPGNEKQIHQVSGVSCVSENHLPSSYVNGFLMDFIGNNINGRYVDTYTHKLSLFNILKFL